MEARMKQLEGQLAMALGGIEQRIKGEFAPMSRVVAETAQDKFLTTIHSVHPDADTLLPEVDKWIASQPKFLQATYNQVLENGSAQDVVAVYDTFKQATGRTGQSEQQESKAPSREQRLRQMEGVKAERTSATAISDDDFEGAFNRAAQTH
jgi:triphosphoribosyl-dephospho-CoA synthetase